MARRTLAVFMTVAATATVAVPAAVGAQPRPTRSAAQMTAPTTRVCVTPILVTDFGPLRSCTEISDARGRTGFYSLITMAFMETTGWTAVAEKRPFELTATATDGQVGLFTGHTSLRSAQGEVVHGVQHQAGRGRFGHLDPLTSTFYPNGDGAWRPITS